MAPACESQNQSEVYRIVTNTFHLANLVFLPYPYPHRGIYSCWMDDNIFYGNQEIAHRSIPESHPGLHRIHLHRQYLEITYSKQRGLALLPEKKRPPSFRYKPHHCMSVHHLPIPNYNSTLPDGRSHRVDRCLDRILHPYKRASNSENPYRCNWLPDTLSYPDKS